MMKIAVTGASGFIGRHVLAELNLYSAEIVAVTRNICANKPILNRGRWVTMDIHHPPANAFEVLECPDILIHLAWQGLPHYKSLHHFDDELPYQYAFLKQLIEQGLPSVLVSGTCFEYGMQSGALSEDFETKPVNPYGFAKDTLRKQLQFFQDTSPFNLTWTRLFYLYGESQPATSLFPQLKKAAEQGLSEFNMSGGEQLRDYLPVTEVARKLLMLAFKQENYGLVNLCSGKPIAVRSLVEKWIKENNWNIELNLGYYPYPDYEPMAFWGNDKKINTILADESTN